MPTYRDAKTGLWYCKFVYTDWTGKKIQKKKMGFKLQKEAKAFKTEFLSKAHASCDMLFSCLVELYMKYTVTLQYDNKANVWLAAGEDIQELALEADTEDMLT